jgi:hypothetical protein
MGIFTGSCFALDWQVRNREVHRGDNSDSLRDGAYHPIWLHKNAARHHTLHEDTRHVVCGSASSPDRDIG